MHLREASYINNKKMILLQVLSLSWISHAFTYNIKCIAQMKSSTFILAKRSYVVKWHTEHFGGKFFTVKLKWTPFIIIDFYLTYCWFTALNYCVSLPKDSRSVIELLFKVRQLWLIYWSLILSKVKQHDQQRLFDFLVSRSRKNRKKTCDIKSTWVQKIKDNNIRLQESVNITLCLLCCFSLSDWIIKIKVELSQKQFSQASQVSGKCRTVILDINFTLTHILSVI